MIDRASNTRRSFLQVTGTTAALATMGPARLLADQDQKEFAPPIGVCTSLKNASILRESGAVYLDAGHLLHQVHIAEKANCTSPGVDGDDFRPYLAALAKVGYRGGISIECRWKELATELPVATRTLRE